MRIDQIVIVVTGDRQHGRTVHLGVIEPVEQMDAARAIETLAIDIGDLHRDGALEEIPGVGAAIAKKVAEFLETGHLSYYDQLKRELAPEAEELLDVPSIGPERARMIGERLGITHLIDLERAARAQRLRTLPGIGPVLERRIAQEAAELRRARTPAGSS